MDLAPGRKFGDFVGMMVIDYLNYHSSIVSMMICIRIEVFWLRV